MITWNGQLGDGTYVYMGKHRKPMGNAIKDRVPNPSNYEGKHRPPETLWELIRAAHRKGR